MDRQKRHIARLKKKVARFGRQGKACRGLMREIAIQSGTESPGRPGRPGKPSLRFLGKPRCCWPKNKMIDSMIDRGGVVPSGGGSKRRPAVDPPEKVNAALAQVKTSEG
jgi:hypothetical protein